MIPESGFLTVYIFSMVFIFGIIFGSFINCMSWRIVNGESVLKGRSHCTDCGHELGILDLVPVLSYVFLKGRCRYCQSRIAPRYMLVEILLGILFMIILASFGISWKSVEYMILTCILLGLSLVDLNIYEIPNRFIIVGIVNWIAFLPLIPSTIGQVKNGLLGGFLIAGSLMILSIVFDKLTGKESLGGGDIKLFFMTGLYMGMLESLFCLILSCILGIVFSLVIKKERIPFGPFISVAVFITLLIGSTVTGWYMSLFI